jgi:uncharacterized damage-inducible protein DinB
MSTNLIESYRRWFQYEQDVHDKVFASFQTVPADRRGSAEYKRAVSIMGHIVAARRMWLVRLGVIRSSGPAVLFPDGQDIEQVIADWREVQGLWVSHLASLDDAALEREFEYQSLDAGRFRNRVGDIFTQLFGHSWYHRGQIAMLIKSAGGQPAITDLIHWCREAVGR